MYCEILKRNGVFFGYPLTKPPYADVIHLELTGMDSTSLEVRKMTSSWHSTSPASRRLLCCLRSWSQESVQWHFDGAETCEERLVNAFLHSHCRHSSHLGFHLIVYISLGSEGSEKGGSPIKPGVSRLKWSSFERFGIHPWNRTFPSIYNMLFLHTPAVSWCPWGPGTLAPWKKVTLIED